MAGTVTVSKYLIVTPSGKGTYSKALVKMVDSITKASVGANSIAIKVSIDIPASLFQKPSLEVNVKIPEGSVTPVVLRPEVLTSIEEIIRERMDIKTTIRVVEEP